jgi:hypothetical protein
MWRREAARPRHRDTTTSKGSTEWKAAPSPSPSLLQLDKPAEEEERGGVGELEDSQRCKGREDRHEQQQATLVGWVRIGYVEIGRKRSREGIT